MKLKNITKEEFIRQAVEKHGYKYNYSKIIFKDLYTPIIIICPIHGEFTDLPCNHLRNNGCKKCKFIELRVVRKLTTDEFIQKAILVHGNKYDYSLVSYIDSRTKVIIICPKHGEFYMKPNNHLNGRGCPICYLESANSNLRHTQQEFIEKAKKIHGNRYDYSKVIYMNSSTKVIIICPVHGEFEQTPQDHLSGKGCLRCKESKGEQFIAEILDRYNIKYIREYKIPNQIYKFRYDFYLPDHNLLIEFHGEQHFFPVNIFGGDDSYQRNVERDIFKKELAKMLNYRFIEFNYKQLKTKNRKNFESQLIKILKRWK